ncbi:MAG: bifunctional diaminohydroxyphosphoribosylaminopyrimidine deaminase/5-amino-6-(5-phosphoribosylamino)uracil reductase RibD [Pseudomonadota bacterium]
MPPFGDHDRRWMAAALALAHRGLGQVWPNPAVGCVIVQDGHLVGRGWTQPGGRPHAETMALAQAGAAAKGATAYISLEPCAHHGKTPPCADALIGASIARIVAPMEDPDPRVAGKGFDRLRAAGMTVDTGLMIAEAEAANAGFLARQRRGRPWLTLKMAATLDGRIATRTGDSQWITGPEARARVHLMRAHHDAVMVGTGTARADDPRLDVRLPGLTGRHPVRVVLDAALSLPDTCQLAMTRDHAGPVWRIAEAGRTGWGDVIGVRRNESGLDLDHMMQALGARGLTRVLCEGGGTLAGALLKAGLIDELVWFSAGAAIGGDGAAALGPLNIAALAEMPRMTLSRTEMIGADLMSVWRPA